MHIIDSFFSGILAIQFFLEKVEKWYLNKRKYLIRVFILAFIIEMILIICKQVLLGKVVFILGMLFVGFDNIVGWKYSVRRWLKICVIYNLLFSLMLADMAQRFIRCAIVIPAFVTTYLIVWIFLSLISNSKVSLLVNEIISGITTTIFTIGTYIISMLLKKLPLSSDYLLYFQTNETFMQALTNKDSLAERFLEAGILEWLEEIFLSVLPIIGVTALSIIMIKIKEYWMEKNEVIEPEEEIV